MRISHGAVPAALCPTRYAIDVVDLSHDCFNDVFNQERKIRRNKIRLHDWSVKEHQERGSDWISSGYGSFDLPINLSFNGVDSVSRHGNRSSTSILNAIFRSFLTFWDDSQSDHQWGSG